MSYNPCLRHFHHVFCVAVELSPPEQRLRWTVFVSCVCVYRLHRMYVCIHEYYISRVQCARRILVLRQTSSGWLWDWFISLSDCRWDSRSPPAETVSLAGPLWSAQRTRNNNRPTNGKQHQDRGERMNKKKSVHYSYCLALEKMRIDKSKFNQFICQQMRTTVNSNPNEQHGAQEKQ